MNFDEIFFRIKKGTNSKTQKEVATRLNIREASITAAKQRGEIPDSWLIKLYKEYGLNISWLLDGIEPMSVKEIRSNSENPLPIALPPSQLPANTSEDTITSQEVRRVKSEVRKINCEFLYEIDEWLTELVKKKAFKNDWFVEHFLDSFSLFQDWRERKKLEQDSLTKKNNTKAEDTPASRDYKKKKCGLRASLSKTGYSQSRRCRRRS